VLTRLRSRATPERCADAFALEGTDGKTYALTSPTVKLDEHVGHKVTVTGKSAAVETGATGAGGLSVSSLKMVSTQCK
jgi:hypothetical protein